MALRAGGRENAATITASQAMRAVWLGLFTQATTLAEAGLKYEGNQVSVPTAARALALAGDRAWVAAISADLATRYPKNTLVNQWWLPEIKAALALSDGDARAAVDALEAARRLEAADEFVQKSLRAAAFLKLEDGQKAATESAELWTIGPSPAPCGAVVSRAPRSRAARSPCKGTPPSQKSLSFQNFHGRVRSKQTAVLTTGPGAPIRAYSDHCSTGSGARRAQTFESAAAPLRFFERNLKLLADRMGNGHVLMTVEGLQHRGADKDTIEVVGNLPRESH